MHSTRIYTFTVVLTALILGCSGQKPDYVKRYYATSDFETPTVGEWIVRDGTKACIQCRMGVQITFQYTDVHKMNQSISYNVPGEPGESTTMGQCAGKFEKNEEILEVSFFDDWIFGLIFRYNAKDSTWKVQDLFLEFKFDEPYFPNISDASVFRANLTDENLFHTPNGSSFMCQNSFTLELTAPSKAPKVSVTFYNLRIEAFRQGPHADFTHPVPCETDIHVSRTELLNFLTQE